jgi:hypothetical protein
MTRNAMSPVRQCITPPDCPLSVLQRAAERLNLASFALDVIDVEFRAGQLLARARWRRCFAFSLALRLFARIVLLDLTVLFT